MRKKLDLLIATRNQGKAREIRKALKGLGLRLYTLSDFSIVPEVKEDGQSFEENAFKKARFYSKRFGKLTLSDDSGLEVDALKGQPGIHSARYAGEGARDHENNRKLLREMEGIPSSKRGARFKCIIAVVSPQGKERMIEGTCRGRIGFREVGKRGFGYDPLFIVPKFGKTMAQLSLEEKNLVSHRGKALKKLRKVIEAFRE